MKYWILLTVLLLVIIYLTIDLIPPQDKTISALTGLKNRIELYANSNNKLPDNLNDLPMRPEYDDSITDGWDRPIIYDYNSTTSMVFLTSCGEKGDCQCKNNGDCIIKKFKIELP